MLSLIPTVANCRDRHGFRRALPLENGWLPTVGDSLLALLENKMVGFFVKYASFSSPFFTAHRVPSTISRLVTASPNTPARLSRLLLKSTSTEEGWGLGFFANKATDG